MVNSYFWSQQQIFKMPRDRLAALKAVSTIIIFVLLLNHKSYVNWNLIRGFLFSTITMIIHYNDIKSQFTAIILSNTELTYCTSKISRSLNILISNFHLKLLLTLWWKPDIFKFTSVHMYICSQSRTTKTFNALRHSLIVLWFVH